ncbi:MAG: hypothetical protein ABIO70_17110 [Pseudomonadota bacterium]
MMLSGALAFQIAEPEAIAPLRGPGLLCTPVASRTTRYEVFLRDGPPEAGLRELAGWLGEHRALVVTTPTVRARWGAALAPLGGPRVRLLELACDERSKGLALVERICAEAMRAGLGRRDFIVGVGGGVCTDLCTMAASVYKRGVRHLRVPTTLVGQVDASIGVKGAVNFCGFKSHLGCFHAPWRVLVLPAFLATLPVRRLREGLAEIVKIALVRDPALFDLVERHGRGLLAAGFQAPPAVAWEVLERASLRMIEELQPNLFEDRTYERLVDFGHTFSIPLEPATGHALSHGEAVAVDMALSMEIAVLLGLAPAALRDRVLALLQALGLPTWSEHLDLGLCHAALEQAVAHRGGRPNLVLPTQVGRALFLTSSAGLPPALLEAALQRLRLAQGC